MKREANGNANANEIKSELKNGQIRKVQCSACWRLCYSAPRTTLCSAYQLNIDCVRHDKKVS